MEGLTPAVLEARYRKRMVRIIAKYFFVRIHVLATGTRLSLCREAAKPGPVRPKIMISALNCHRSRRVTSNYFLLLQCSPEQNGAADKSLNLLLIGSMKYKTESFGLFISFSRIHSMNY